MSAFEYRYRLIPLRYWLKPWHWRHWTLTRFANNAGVRNGAWQLWLGPLVITRLFQIGPDWRATHDHTVPPTEPHGEARITITPPAGWEYVREPDGSWEGYVKSLPPVDPNAPPGWPEPQPKGGSD